MGGKRTGLWKYIHFRAACLIFVSLLGCATIQEIERREEVYLLLVQSQKFLARGDFERALDANLKVLSLSPGIPPEDEALYNMGLIYAHYGNVRRDYRKSLQFFERLMTNYPKSGLAEEAGIWANVLQENAELSHFLANSKKETEKFKQTLETIEKPKGQEIRTEDQKKAHEYLERGQKLLTQGDFEGAIEANRKALSLSPGKPPEDEALFNLGLVYAHLGNSKKDFRKSIDFFKKLLKDHPKSGLAEQAKVWTEVLQENEKLNEVIEKSKEVDLEIERRKREKAK